MSDGALVNAVRVSKDADFLKSIGLNFYNDWAVKAIDAILERQDISNEFKKAVSFHKEEIEHLKIANSMKTPIRELSEVAKKYHGDTRAAALCTLARKDAQAFKDTINNCEISPNELKILSDNMRYIPLENILNDAFYISYNYFNETFNSRKDMENVANKIIDEPILV